MLFDEANEKGSVQMKKGPYIEKCLRVYEVCLGQCINYNKSMVSFHFEYYRQQKAIDFENIRC